MKGGEYCQVTRQASSSCLGMETSFKRDYEIVSYRGRVEVKNIVKPRQASSSRLEVGWGKLSNEKSCCFSRASFA